MAERDIIEQSDLATIIAAELRNSSTYDQSELSQRRSLTLEYLRGIMPDIPPRPNGSSQTSRDINDTISWMLPSLTRTLVSNGKMVKFEQVRNEPLEWASQATAYTNWSFFIDNVGYQIVRNATYDSLAHGNGVACSYWEDEQSKTETLRSQSMEDISDLMEDSAVQILAADMEPQPEAPGVDPLTNEATNAPSFTLKIKRITRRGKICDESCKVENLYLNAYATTIESSRFVAYLFDNLTRSDLMEMAKDYGWDKGDIEDLPASHNEMMSQVSQARRYDLSQVQSSPIRSGDQINLYRCFPSVDVDGDGIAERIEAWFAGDIGGGKVLGWEVWDDDIPYTDIPCYPLPHRWDAESVADRTKDIQRVKTVLLRALLDSTYAAVMPQREVDLGSVLNPDILTNPRFGGIIWKKPGSPDIRPHEVPYTGDKSLMAMQAMDEIITKRTGVSRTMMALDPEALTNQTATANQNLRDAAMSQIELIARDMAEYGWAKFFKKRLKLAIKYHEIADIPNPDAGQQDQKFIQVKPGVWDENMAVSINVGLGTGSRDRDMAMLNVMLGGQTNMAMQLAQTGLPTGRKKGLEFIPKIRETAVLLADAAGVKNPESFYPPITDQDIQQMEQEASQAPGPPEAVQVEQARQQGAQQLKQMDIQVQQAEQQARLVVDQQNLQAESAAQVRREQAQLEADMQTKAADREKEITLARINAQTEANRLAADDAYRYAALAQQRELEMLKLGAQPVLKAQEHAQTLEEMAIDNALQQERAQQAADLAPDNKPE